MVEAHHHMEMATTFVLEQMDMVLIAPMPNQVLVMVEMALLTIHMVQVALHMDQVALHMDQVALHMDQVAHHMDPVALHTDQVAHHMDPVPLHMDQVAHLHMDPIHTAQVLAAVDTVNKAVVQEIVINLLD